jgi:hypothetical protein
MLCLLNQPPNSEDAANAAPPEGPPELAPAPGLVLGAVGLEAAHNKEDEGEGEFDDEGEQGPDKKKRKKLRSKVGARVVVGVRVREQQPALDSDGQPVGQVERTASLQLRQARAKFDVRYLDILRVRISAEFADLLDSPKNGRVIRDAWGNIEIHPAFQIKVGRFKRPYSRLELRGFSKIPFTGRGLFNGFAVEDLGWGDRAVGVSLWGKLEPERPGFHELRWAVSASRNLISGAPHGVDVHARLSYDPLAWLSIAASGAYKHVQDTLADEAACLDDWRRDPGCRRDVFGAGVDLAVDIAGFYASVEADFAQDWMFADKSPWTLGALAYASYDFELPKRFRLQPVAYGEYIDTNLSYAESEAVRAVGALNLLWTKHLRVMPQVHYTVPLPPVTAFNRFVESWVVGVWVGVQL